ncbi:hypothetical protein MNEG_2769 [Monoraphidium neglectum]|uniref:Uncharacterized protein n=1 Tax=Monoraphidium neglectum TaxID=145388 RepID=A0A0D2NK82_9CHLO|nr:hypothetical protein MNEG_2769 [Monoraphidium neglectum]KIZ05191.1 hypothetical protein MNEG_2769 [Monoraphidium neglectum]|eukprot:XP_013904210.1 hypothetical protein MNEG_2769 [Monoraphidium neglectum]
MDGAATLAAARSVTALAAPLLAVLARAPALLEADGNSMCPALAASLLFAAARRGAGTSLVVSAPGSAAAVAAALRAACGAKGRGNGDRVHLLYNAAALAAFCTATDGGDVWALEVAAPRHGALRALVKAARAGPAAFAAPAGGGGYAEGSIVPVDPMALRTQVACALGSISFALRDPYEAAAMAAAAARDAAAAALPPDDELRALVWGGLAAGGREGLSLARVMALRSTVAQCDLAATPGALAWLAAAAIDGAGDPGPAGVTSGKALQVLHTLSGGEPQRPPERGCVPCTDAGADFALLGRITS